MITVIYYQPFATIMEYWLMGMIINGHTYQPFWMIVNNDILGQLLTMISHYQLLDTVYDYNLYNTHYRLYYTPQPTKILYYNLQLSYARFDYTKPTKT